MPSEREIVELAYVAYERGDVDDPELRRHALPGYRFHPRAGWPGEMSYGIDDMPRLWADLRATFSGYSLEPIAFLETPPNWVLVQIATSTAVHGEGPRMEDTFFHLWRFEHGRIAETRTLRTEEEARAFISGRRNAA